MSTALTIITRDELKRRIDTGDKFVLLDTLPESSFEAHHIPTARNADVRQADFIEKVRAIVPDTSTPIVAYCMSFNCTLTPMAAHKLKQAGYTDIAEYKGGLADWQDAGYAFEGGVPQEKIGATCTCSGCGCD